MRANLRSLWASVRTFIAVMTYNNKKKAAAVAVIVVVVAVVVIFVVVVMLVVHGSKVFGPMTSCCFCSVQSIMHCPVGTGHVEGKGPKSTYQLQTALLFWNVRRAMPSQVCRRETSAFKPMN